MSLVTEANFVVCSYGKFQPGQTGKRVDLKEIQETN